MPEMYKLGVSNALTQLGLASQDESHLGRNLAIGGSVAALPFAGLIGRQRMLHDPHAGANITRTEKLRDLAREMKAGDILVSTNPKWSGWRAFQAPITGSHFYHTDLGVLPGKILSAGSRYPDEPKPKNFILRNGEFDEKAYERALKWHEKAVAEAKAMPTRRALWQSTKVEEALPELGYTESVLLRPRAGLSPEQLNALKQRAAQGAALPYDVSHGTRGVLHELFVPKLNAIQRLKEKLRPSRACVGNVCSTYPAQAYAEAGILDRIVRGKSAPVTLTPDFLRAPELEPILHYRAAGQEIPMSVKKLQRLGLLGRAGLGLGLGGLTYGTLEDPTLAAGVAGAAATPMATRAIIDALKGPETGEKVFRPVPALLTDINRLAEATPTVKAKGLRGLKNIFGRTVPLALAGGLATYLGAKGIQKAIQSE